MKGSRRRLVIVLAALAIAMFGLSAGA